MPREFFTIVTKRWISMHFTSPCLGKPISLFKWNQLLFLHTIQSLESPDIVLRYEFASGQRGVQMHYGRRVLRVHQTQRVADLVSCYVHQVSQPDSCSQNRHAQISVLYIDQLFFLSDLILGRNHSLLGSSMYSTRRLYIIVKLHYCLPLSWDTFMTADTCSDDKWSLGLSQMFRPHVTLVLLEHLECYWVPEPRLQIY